MNSYEKMLTRTKNDDVKTGRLIDALKDKLKSNGYICVDFYDVTYNLVVAWDIDYDTYMNPSDELEKVMRWIIDNATYIGGNVDYVALGRMIPENWLFETTRIDDDYFMSVYCDNDTDYLRAWVIVDLIIGNYSEDDYINLCRELGL